ncbi:fluoride efflux transporter FluC [Agrilactobacillus fermenti]|uniref:fluoride efflux transporter FluC n=1 Tax=Agrilactobacillus fermenti TaxID=2586909 RepID=UPI001E307B24|nr:CrcB family protein [Agrilactobacillus fermenti]MCD2257092.1 CrcB family protein [Agrilactobacillus fermenti]
MMYLLAAGGAGLGAMGRYGLTEVIKRHSHSRLPLATLWINWLGSFCLAFMFGYHLPVQWYQFLGVGLLGGFTTFSTLNSELSGLLYAGQFRIFLRYFFLTYILGLLFALVGFLTSYKWR